MRVEIREPAGSDVACERRRGPPAGEVRRSDDAVPRVGAPAALDADALRTAVAAAVRALRDDGRPVSWSIDAALGLAPPEQARAIVEGAAFGAYDAGLYKHGRRRRRPELTLAHRRGRRAARADRAAGGRRTPSRRGARPRQPSAERPLPGRARRATRRRSRSPTSRSRRTGATWIEEQGMGAFAAVGASSRARAAADRPALRPARRARRLRRSASSARRSRSTRAASR